MATVVLCASDIGLSESWRVGLEQRGHEVILASSAATAADRLREGGVDVAVVDFEVSRGIVPVTRVLARLPDSPPLVLVSGTPDAPAMSARLGAAAFVPKPCTPEELTQVIERLAAA
jgi:DNA-binding NtrC family response regulator